MKYYIAFLVLITGMFTPSTSPGQSGGGFEIDRSTVSDAGGGRSLGSGFELHGTIGQTDAGLHAGSDFTLSGGFWVDAETDVLFKDGYE